MTITWTVQNDLSSGSDRKRGWVHILILTIYKDPFSMDISHNYTHFAGKRGRL